VSTAVVSAAVVSTGVDSTVKVSVVTAVSAGLEPQNVSVNAKTPHKTVAKAIFNDFFMISGLKFALIQKTWQGHPRKKNIFIGLP
jgi:hypothetical protein